MIFTHSIRYLIEVALKFDEEFKTLLDIKAPKLSKYYTGTRYLPLLEVSEEEAREAVEIAEKVREFVLKKLGYDFFRLRSLKQFYSN